MPGVLSVAERIFVPLFFVSIGLGLDFYIIDLPLQTVAAVPPVPFAGKLAGPFIGTHVARLETQTVLAISLIAKGVAEIALLVVLLENGAIGDQVSLLLVFVMFGYIVLAPPALSLAVSKAKQPQHAPTQMAMPPSFARYVLEGVSVSSVMDWTRTYFRRGCR